MLLQSQRAALYVAPVAMHDEVEGRVIVIYGGHQPLDGDACLQFLPNLAL